MSGHTPGPWFWRGDGFLCAHDPYDNRFSHSVLSAEPSLEDAETFVLWGRDGDKRRIVACVNACAGIPTEALEAGAVKELIETLALAEEGLSIVGQNQYAAYARAALAKVRP